MVIFVPIECYYHFSLYIDSCTRYKHYNNNNNNNDNDNDNDDDDDDNNNDKIYI